MKRLFLSAIAMVLLALPMSAQKIFEDKTSPDGTRSISTKSKMIIALGKGGISYSIINYVQPTEDEQYYIRIGFFSAHNFNIPKEGLLLMKTASGDIIECKQILDTSETGDPVGTYSTITKTIDHHISGIYPISLSNLKKIAKDGLIKVRVDTSEGYREADYKEKNRKRTQEYFHEALENISIAKEKSSNIRDGF